MNIFTKAAFTVSLAMSFSLASVSVFAEEEAQAPAAATSSTSSTSEVISHIEKALVEVSKSDFSAAQVHLKAARTASELIAGNSDVAKKAHSILIQGQILSKNGNVSRATEELNKALALYKSL
ncbi:hypothetical protein IVG45_14620 [Methylomonas sp. LL1]|uniref:hypothetical protein n=1 Tax=Methylomonas sp. LL1 TaxID=2785785 RepID=UPI0018C35395|nr:hypothetical protein [Methylomonas sp. LL1]QPK62088.1 hypothetical protein IVG45_14620 [Methylomonas sp. LL1]